MQRNASTQFIDPDDKDIVIVSRRDEILDSRRADEVIWAVQKYDIVTVKLGYPISSLTCLSIGGPALKTRVSNFHYDGTLLPDC